VTHSATTICDKNIEKENWKTDRIYWNQIEEKGNCNKKVIFYGSP
jgi:hypothetical protein